MLRLFCIFLLTFIFSCATSQVLNTVLFKYEDFWPPVAANELIGMDWWQWQTSGDPRPREYDIKVVIYKDISLKDVKQLFPVNPSVHQDYRYVEYSIVVDYLDELIQENTIESMTSKLIVTRARIRKIIDEGKWRKTHYE